MCFLLTALPCVALAQVAPAVQATINPAWLRVTAADSTAQFDLLAGMSGLNGGMNFNDRANGQLTLVVPVGWHVVLHFRNADQNLPHSAAVIPMATPVPVGAGTPAFAHAITHRPDQGLPSDGHEDIRFLADKAGLYMIFCAVPGHGAAGMWMRLDVSTTAAGAAVTASR